MKYWGHAAHVVSAMTTGETEMSILLKTVNEASLVCVEREINLEKVKVHL